MKSTNNHINKIISESDVQGKKLNREIMPMAEVIQSPRKHSPRSLSALAIFIQGRQKQIKLLAIIT